MGLVFAVLGMIFLLSVGALAIGTVVSLGAIFFGYPLGWGIATAIACLAFASSGWKGLSNLGLGSRGISNNAEGAFGLLHVSALAVVIVFSLSELPQQISAWWALLMPLIVIPSLVIQWGFELVLNVLNPSGKRELNQG